jgi:hypothetical protein
VPQPACTGYFNYFCCSGCCLVRVWYRAQQGEHSSSSSGMVPMLLSPAKAKST